MPTKNTLIVLCTAALLGIAWLFLFVPSAPQEILPARHKSSQEMPRTQNVQTEASSPAQAQTQAALIVPEHRYPVSLDGEKTVLGAMQELSSSGAFTFDGKEFPSLGFFVESINGVRNAGGKYWMLYRNGAQSQVGVSRASISPGDVIEWKYE